MSHLKCNKPKSLSMAQVGWTLLVLLAALIATEMAEAQTTQPQTRPSGPSASAAVSGDAARASAPVENLPIDVSKCTTDLDSTKKLIKQEIMKSIREAQAAGYEPSISYERVASTSMQSRVEARGNSQAEKLTSSLFAAINSPENAANAASEKINGSPNRRASMEMYSHCQGDDPVPRKILENQIYLGNQRGTCDKVLDMGINASQVFQTTMPANRVVNQFARAKLQSSEKNTVTLCPYDRRTCATPENYSLYDTTNWLPPVGKEFFTKDTTTFGALASMWMHGDMVNRTVTKITPVNICGSKAYMISAFQNGGALGFDRSSLIGMVAPIGGKTIVIGDLSTQGYTQGSYPLEFPKKWDETRDFILGKIDPQTRRASGGYYSMARLIGSTETPIMGEVPAQASRPASRSSGISQ